MKVDKVNLNNINKVGINSNNQSISANKGQIGFKGKTPIKVDTIQKEIDQFMPKSMQMVYKLGSRSGELQDIIINALGTGLIAPVFIKWNPLSKADEDTRTYSAWRQPVSAVLAVATQGLITIPFDKLVTNMTNSGRLMDSFNKTAFRDDDYIAKTIKANKPNISKVELEKEVKRIKDTQKEELLNSIRRDNTIHFQQAKNAKTTSMSSKEFAQYTQDTIAELIRGEQDELKRCSEIKVPHRIERSDFYRQNADKTRTLLTEIQNKINSTNNVKEIDKFLATKENALKGKTADKSLFEIVQELRARAIYGNRPEVHAEMKNKVSKIFDHIKLYENAKDIKEVEKIVRKNLKNRKDELDSTISFLQDLEAQIKKGTPIGKIEQLLKDKIKACPDSRIAKYDNFVELIADKFKTKVGNNIKGLKRLTSLIVAFAMLPVSCSLLNWVYPRFMDAIFPNLSNKKHSNETNDFVDKANRNKGGKS